jgi:hypothetical protein
MSDKIKRFTPREIAEMLIGEQAYQSTLFVTAADHDAEIERLRARVAVLEKVDAAARGIWDPFYRLHAAVSEAARQAAREDKP